MVMEEKSNGNGGGGGESCGSRASDTSSASSPVSSAAAASKSSRQQRQKLEVYNEVLRRLKESKNDDANLPSFDDELWTHFNRLPTRYCVTPLSLICPYIPYTWFYSIQKIEFLFLFVNLALFRFWFSLFL